MLRPALLGDDNETARQVAQTHRRTGLIALLPTGAAGPISIHLTLRQQLRVAESRPDFPADNGHTQIGERPAYAGRSPILTQTSSFHGARMGRLNILLASGSLNTSATEA